MTSADQVVTAYDWIRGVSFSVAASIIGGASKLSIRKSWLIDVDLKRLKTATAFNIDEGEGCGVLVNEIAVKWTHRNPPPEYNASGDTVTHLNNDVVEKESAHKNSHLTPLEMTAPSSRGASAGVPTPESLRQDVFSMEGGDDEELYDCQQNHDPTSIQQMKNISWFLYISGMIGMTFLNPLCCVLAMKYASPSILAPFSGLTLVWVILFSGMCVGEHPKLSQKVACTLIVLGEVMVALFGDHTNHEWNTYEEVIVSYQEPLFQILIFLMLSWVFFLGMVIWKFPKTSLTRKLAWGAIGGSITGFQNFLKDSLTIYDVMKENGDSSLPAIFFLFMGLAMLTSFMGLLCLAACMKRFDATYSSSMFVVSFVISASLMSAVHYQTFQHLGSIDDDILYPMGLLVLLWGAAILIKPSAICFTDEIDLSEEESNSDSSGCPPGRRGNRERLLS